ncbi:MAG TPA: polymorphic toxin-type HINT domain-containing protein [Pyrinomonadaceae bacterium]|nr:polymorphic toxin-type HINT domain-containing protein [Pyrinomonadaceae bacterium]
MSRQTHDSTKTSKPHETPAPDSSLAPHAHASAHALLDMQRAFGNRAVGRYLQAERAVSRPTDAHEQQADALSQRLLSEGALPPGAITPLAQPHVQRQLADEPATELSEDIIINTAAPPVGGVEDSAPEGALPAAPEAAPSATPSAAKEEEKPVDLNLPLDRLKQAVLEIGNYLQTTEQKREEQAEELNKLPAEEDGKKASVKVLVPIDKSLLTVEDINYERAVRAFQVLFKMYGIYLNRDMAGRLHARAAWRPLLSAAKVRAKTAAALEKGLTETEYLIVDVPGLMADYRQIIAEDKARYERIIKELHEVHYAEDAVKSFYIAHWNGILGLIGGLQELTVAPYNLVQRIRGAEGVHLEQQWLKDMKIDYPGKYGEKYGTTIETGVAVGLMVVPGGALSESAAVGTSWLARLVSGLKPGGVPVGTAIVNSIRVALTTGVISAGGLAVDDLRKTATALATGQKVLPDGKTEPLTEDEAGKMLESLIMQALMIYGGVKAVQHLKPGSAPPPESKAPPPPEAKAPAERPAEPVAPPPEPKAAPAEAKPAEATPTPAEAKPAEPTPAEPAPAAPKPAEAKPVEEARPVEEVKPAEAKADEAKPAETAPPVAETAAPVPETPAPAPEAPAAATPAPTEAPAPKPAAKKPRPKKAKAPAAEAAPAAASPEAAPAAPPKAKRPGTSKKKAEPAPAEPAKTEPAGPTPQQRMEALRQENARLQEELRQTTAEKNALEKKRNELEKEHSDAVNKANAPNNKKAPPEVKEQLQAEVDAAEARAAEAEGAAYTANLKVEEIKQAIKRNEADIARTEIALDPTKHRALLPCFAGDTEVWTIDGPLRIDELRPGATVFAYDFTRLEVVRRTVTEVHRNKTVHFYDVRVGHHVVCATGQHLFWVESESDWIPARSLRRGMRLGSLGGESRPIDDIALREVAESASYNLSVEGAHNYFVGPGLLVHNEGPIDVKLGGKYIIYRATYHGKNEKLKGKTYIGQTTTESLRGASAGTPRGVEARQGEHIAKALKELAKHEAGLKQLADTDVEFYEFMKDAELKEIVVGAETKPQADYLEQKNIKAERAEFGEDNVMNRREQIKSEAHAKQVEEKIVAELAAKGRTCPP